MVKTLQKVFALIAQEDKRRFFFILLFSVFVSFVELGAVAAIMPFVQSAIDFDAIDRIALVGAIYRGSGIEKPQYFVIAFGIALMIFYLLRALINLIYYHKLSSFVRKSYRSISSRLFRNFVGFSYRNFVERNSAELIKTITTEAEHASGVLSSFVLIFGEAVVVAVIYGALLFVNWKMTLLMSAFLALSAWVLVKSVRNRIKAAGERRAREHQAFYETLTSTFGNFKMFKLQSKEEEIIRTFDEGANRLMRAFITNETLMHVPRLVLEALGFSLVVFIVVYWIVVYDSDVAGFIGVLSLFILSLYRLLPSINRIITGYNQVVFFEKSLDNLIEALGYEKERIGNVPVDFKRAITLRGVTFRYEENKAVLKEIDLEIYKGQKVAFIGESGSGKSTLIDLIIGLYKPQKGEIFIDNTLLSEETIRSWRQKIGYIPQEVYLFDATVAENVALAPSDELDRAKVQRVLKQAKIWEFLEREAEGIETKVGEGGVRLSGGQKQRIAIARALYHDPEVLVLDEATSALDEATELEIMQEIYEASRTKTLLVIAHRLSTIKGCDVIYRVQEGKVIKYDT